MGWSKSTARFALQGKPPNRVLGYRTFQVFEFVKAHIAEHHVSPSYRQIAEALDLPCHSHVNRIVQRLERRGLAYRDQDAGYRVPIIRIAGEEAA